MPIKIYFNNSGERKGPYSVTELIDKLHKREFSLIDFVYCEDISEIWIPIHEFIIKFYPQICNDKIYISTGDGSIEDPVYFDKLINKILSDKRFVDQYLLYNEEEKNWQLFKDFLISHTISQVKQPANEINEKSISSVQSEDSEFLTEIDDIPAEIKILDQMIAESSEFKKLSSSLSGFNLWELFDIETAETFNEKMLLWLLNENESHNLGDFFLRRWLILILHKDLNSQHRYKRPLNALNIEYARVVDSSIESQKMIQINGRTRYLDLFIDLKTLRQEDWVIIIEIKVGTHDHENQLSDYRQWLKETYPNHKKLTIFLYDENLKQQLPDDEDRYWPKTTFSDVRNVIKEALNEKKGLIPFREESFIEQYMENLPPLAPEGKSENLADLTHKLFGNYSKGILYANDANKKEDDELDSWQIHAKHFVRERKKEFLLLEKQDEYRFVRNELINILKSKEWFPETSNIRDIVTYSQGEWGVDLVDLMKENDSKWKESVHSEHLRVYLHLFWGTYQREARFRLRLRIPAQENFIEERNNLIKDFFSQVNPSNYGGNNATNEATGLIYNKVLDYENSDNLFTLCRSIISSFKEIWCDPEDFSMALDAIFEKVRSD